MKFLQTIGIAVVVLLAWPSAARSQSWQPVNHTAPFSASTALLLTDGTVLVQQYFSPHWWKLTPDNTGSYVNGTWTQLADLPSGYAPLYYSSAVLKDGRVVVNGGEYNNGVQSFTTLGAIYDPVKNVWASLSAPSGWSTIGDAQNTVLPNGLYFLANCCTTQEALLNPKTLAWVETGKGKADINDEEGWTLLPDGTVLTVDANNTADLTHAEKYGSGPGAWISAGDTVVKLDDTNSNGSGSHELGPALLRPDGTVFATGATGHTSTYFPPAQRKQTGTWVPGPDFPNIQGQGQLDIADGPAVLLPDGNVFCDASPGVFNIPSHFFEYDGTSFTEEPAPPHALNISSYEGRMLLLPTGQVLFTDGSTDVEIYTPNGPADPSLAPTIARVPTQISPGLTYQIQGTQFNGFSQANAYGDDATMATNYPLVQITNQSTGHVFYARTHDHSTMAVGFTGPARTFFDTPANLETGPSNLVVIANGIASNPVTVTVTAN